VFGNGNVAKAITQYISTEKEEEFETIYITTRTPQSSSLQETANNNHIDSEDLRENQTCPSFVNITYIPFENEQTQQILNSCTHVLITIPPVVVVPKNDLKRTTKKNETTMQVPSYLDPILDNPKYNQSYYNQVLVNVSWVGYVSTTGVYGDHDGAWVNETSDCQPSGLKAQCYYDLETRWAQQVQLLGNTQLRIFRCAGIYGQDFSALHTVLKRGSSGEEEYGATTTTTTTIGNKTRPLLVEEKVVPRPMFTSRIHLEDIAQAITSSMLLSEVKNDAPDVDADADWADGLSNSSREVYNLADDHPAQRQDVMNFARSLLADAGMLNKTNRSKTAAGTMNNSGGERAKRRGRDRKRVCNKKMKRDLLVSCGGLKFSSYREGLGSILHCWNTTRGVRSMPKLHSEE
jgi:nucleoside-diphosphate-sugar epimerase